MAVELRCPDCRAKLRLKAAPEAGTEIECPKCATVFTAPEPEPDEDAPKKKKKADEGEGDAGEKPTKGDGEKTEKKEKKAKKGAKGADPGAPRKRKAKKRETSKAALIGVIATGVILMCVMTATLIWYFTRTSKSVEMMYYLPEDTSGVVGWNVGHHQKYPEFYKTSSAQGGLRTPAETIAKAAGTDFDSLVDYAIMGSSAKNGTTLVYRTKTEFDEGDLAKIPGAQKQNLDGKTYYRAALSPGGANPRSRVFAPTNRLIVVAPDNIQEPVFKKMLNGHADNRENTIGMRMGPLGKRITRGTFWVFEVFTEANKPVAPPKREPNPQGGGGDDAQVQLAQTVFETVGGAKGFGAKASLGSREVRLEIVVWYGDGEKASGVAKKWKESELGKGDEGNPPKWFKEGIQSMGDKKVAAQLLSNLGFGSSGELFYAKTSVETVDLQNSAGTVVGKVTGQQQNQGGMTPGTPGPTPGPGGPTPGPPGPGGPVPPGMPRRRVWGRR